MTEAVSDLAYVSFVVEIKSPRRRTDNVPPSATCAGQMIIYCLLSHAAPMNPSLRRGEAGKTGVLYEAVYAGARHGHAPRCHLRNGCNYKLEQMLSAKRSWIV